MGIFCINIKRLEKKGEVEKLIKALEHKKPEVRVEAAEALERFGASEAHEPIINAWSSGKIKINTSVAWAIKETQDAKAVQEIIKHLRSSRKILRATRQRDIISKLGLLQYLSQIDALGIIGDISSLDVLIDELKDYWNTVKERTGESAGPKEFVTNATTDRNLDLSIPRLIEKALIKIGEPAVEPVNELLKSDNVAIRATAENILEKLEASKDVASKGNDTGKGEADIDKRNDKPSVKKIILFWEDIPKAKKAQSFANQLCQGHPELKFETTGAVNERLSSKSLAVQIKRLNIGEVANNLINSIEKDGGNLTGHTTESISKMAAIRALDIAALMIIENELNKKHSFSRTDYPNRLICKKFSADAGSGHYVLIIDSDIDLSTYNFHSPSITGFKLSSISEAVKQPRIFKTIKYQIGD